MDHSLYICVKDGLNCFSFKWKLNNIKFLLLNIEGQRYMILKEEFNHKLFTIVEMDYCCYIFSIYYM